jgi:predicted polyphosphate/ATP-dependent NAD kinase
MQNGIDFCHFYAAARIVLDAIGQTLPVIGIPSGVKMHSGVFAVSPRAAGEIAMRFLWGELPVREAEVADVDEGAFREGRLSSKLYGYLLVPYEPNYIQGTKAPTPVSDSASDNMAAIAKYVADNMEEGVVYVMGPGSTVKAVSKFLGLDFTLLGVDLLYGKKLIKADANENEILEEISGRKAHIVVSPIGGQGFIFGRGNQQISAEVLRKLGRESVTVISTRDKLAGLDLLRIDTGDEQLDSHFRGPIKVLVDYGIFEVKKVA